MKNVGCRILLYTAKQTISNNPGSSIRRPYQRNILTTNGKTTEVRCKIWMKILKSIPNYHVMMTRLTTQSKSTAFLSIFNQLG
jgi:hypothetical protein